MAGKSESGKKSRMPAAQRRDEAEQIVAPMAPAKADAALDAVLSRLGLMRSDLSRRDLFEESALHNGLKLRSYWLHRDFLIGDD